MHYLSVSKHKLRIRLSALLLFVALVLGAVPLAGANEGGPDAMAAGYSFDRQGNCALRQPKGSSWLSWAGYWPWDWGASSHHLQRWNSVSLTWDTMAFGNSGQVYGGANTARANTTAAYQPGQWRVAANYRASFANILPLSSTFLC